MSDIVSIDNAIKSKLVHTELNHLLNGYPVVTNAAGDVLMNFQLLPEGGNLSNFQLGAPSDTVTYTTNFYMSGLTYAFTGIEMLSGNDVAFPVNSIFHQATGGTENLTPLMRLANVGPAGTMTILDANRLHSLSVNCLNHGSHLGIVVNMLLHFLLGKQRLMVGTPIPIVNINGTCMGMPAPNFVVTLPENILRYNGVRSDAFCIHDNFFNDLEINIIYRLCGGKQGMIGPANLPALPHPAVTAARFAIPMICQTVVFCSQRPALPVIPPNNITASLHDPDFMLSLLRKFVIYIGNTADLTPAIVLTSRVLWGHCMSNEGHDVRNLCTKDLILPRVSIERSLMHGHWSPTVGSYNVTENMSSSDLFALINVIGMFCQSVFSTVLAGVTPVFGINMDGVAISTLNQNWYMILANYTELLTGMRVPSIPCTGINIGPFLQTRPAAGSFGLTTDIIVRLLALTLSDVYKIPVPTVISAGFGSNRFMISGGEVNASPILVVWNTTALFAERDALIYNCYHLTDNNVLEPCQCGANSQGPLPFPDAISRYTRPWGPAGSGRKLYGFCPPACPGGYSIQYVLEPRVGAPLPDVQAAVNRMFNIIQANPSPYALVNVMWNAAVPLVVGGRPPSRSQRAKARMGNSQTEPEQTIWIRAQIVQPGAAGGNPGVQMNAPLNAAQLAALAEMQPQMNNIANAVAQLQAAADAQAQVAAANAAANLANGNIHQQRIHPQVNPAFVAQNEPVADTNQTNQPPPPPPPPAPSHQQPQTPGFTTRSGTHFGAGGRA